MRRRLAPLIDSIALANLAIMGSGLLGLILTSRYLGVEERGQYLTWSSWAALVGTLAMLGSEAYIVVAAHSLHVKVSFRSLKGFAVAGMGAAAGAAAFALWAVSGSVEVSIGGALAAVSSQVVAMNSHVQLANEHHGWRYNIARVAAPFAGLATVASAIYWFAPGPEALYLLLGIGLAGGAVISAVVTHESHDAVPHFVGAIWGFARRGSMLTLLGWALVSADTVVVSIFGTSEDVGLYGVGVAARGVVVAVGSSVGMRWFAKREAMQRKMLATSLLPVVLVALAIVLTAHWLVPLVLGAEFEASVPVVQVLSCAGILVSLDFLLQRISMIRDQLLIATLLRIVGLGMLVLGVGLVGGSPKGAACVYLATTGVIVGLQTVLLSRSGR